MSVQSSICLFFLVVILGMSCQHQKEVEKYKWEEGTNAALGYPAEVYRGGLELSDGRYVSLFHGTIPADNGWGAPGGGASSGVKAVPSGLKVKYISYAENQFYYANCKIDSTKIATLFKQTIKRRGASGELMDDVYDQITVGFAPGGVVVVWISGPGRVVEIGRYQAEKTVIPQFEIMQLDSSEHLLFEEEEVKRVMQLESLIPLKIQEANKNKPIPFGLWDTYRISYQWMPLFQLQEGKVLKDFQLSYFNGEMKTYFYEDNLIKKENPNVFYQADNKEYLHIPKTAYFEWELENGKGYVGYITFNEEEIFSAFKTIIGDEKSTKIEVIIRVNSSNTDATVLLRGSNGKEVSLINHDETEFYNYK